MKETGMDYQAIDACTNDHIIYYRQYALENKFPQCELSRCRTDQLTIKVSQSSLRYSHNSTFPTNIQLPKYSTVYELPCKEHK